MAENKTTDAVKLVARLPKALHRRLVRQAARNNVSLNTEIINQLEGYEAATAKRVTEIVQPLLDEAVKTAASIGGRVATENVESLLEKLRRERPRTETESDIGGRLATENDIENILERLKPESPRTETESDAHDAAGKGKKFG